MRFNKEQREGIAKISDNLATACVVASIVGGLVDQKIGWGVSLFLFGIFFVLVWVGIQFRKNGGSNGN